MALQCDCACNIGFVFQAFSSPRYSRGTSKQICEGITVLVLFLASNLGSFRGPLKHGQGTTHVKKLIVLEGGAPYHVQSISVYDQHFQCCLRAWQAGVVITLVALGFTAVLAQPFAPGQGVLPSGAACVGRRFVRELHEKPMADGLLRVAIRFY